MRQSIPRRLNQSSDQSALAWPPASTPLLNMDQTGLWRITSGKLSINRCRAQSWIESIGYFHNTFTLSIGSLHCCTQQTPGASTGASIASIGCWIVHWAGDHLTNQVHCARDPVLIHWWIQINTIADGHRCNHSAWWRWCRRFKTQPANQHIDRNATNGGQKFQKKNPTNKPKPRMKDNYR